MHKMVRNESLTWRGRDGRSGFMDLVFFGMAYMEGAHCLIWNLTFVLCNRVDFRIVIT